MRISNGIAIENGAMNGTDVINGKPIWLGHIAHWAVQAVWTKTGGTLGGAFKVQVSCDEVDENRPDEVQNWTDLNILAEISVSDGDGSGILNLENAGYPWARIVYTNTGGTGTCNVRFNGKGA